MKRSILTEKVARRGYHISREYSVDPLERLSIGEVMTTDVVTVPASLPLRELVRGYFFAPGPRKHPGYPVVDKNGRFFGVITRTNLLEHWLEALTAAPGGVDPLAASPIIAYDLIEAQPVVAYADESCRDAAERMASAGVKRLPVGVAPLRRPWPASRHRRHRRLAQGAPSGSSRKRRSWRAVLRTTRARQRCGSRLE